jgi:hypothetical protein
MIKQREPAHPYDIRDGRAMVSLGPLSTKKFCSFSCPFCYVHADFLSYASMDVPSIVSWLKSVKEPFDIIYVSGDTDSFAAPRTEEGIQLLREMVAFGVDLLFTTRAVFSLEQLRELHSVQQALNIKGKYLFGCVSVAQLSFPHLEPKPIFPPLDRLEQLRRFKELGLVSVLAMRPFLPIVPTSEFLEIVDRVKSFIDVVLGEVWYADKSGVLEKGVFRGPTPKEIEFVDHKMDFDLNDATWKVFEAKTAVRSVSDYCSSLGVPFFMRSRPAIEWVRQQGSRKVIA